MITSATSCLGPRRLPVRWEDAPAIGPLPICRRDGRNKARAGHGCGSIAPGTTRALGGRRFPRGWNAFTLLELMMVITIIGIIATLALPHVRGYGQANSMNAATQQLLDDVALARQRAMADRSTVYMVFEPPGFFTNNEEVFFSSQGSNMLMHQYNAYALVTLSSVGDQPGQHYPHYVKSWQYLPNGVFISPLEYTNYYTNIYIRTTNTLSGAITISLIQPWSVVNGVPFPSVYPPNTNGVPLPCIAFSPQGGLATQFTDQYIVLARGSIFYATDTNGAPLFDLPSVVETPPGNDTNNPNLIQIDWMTARATLLRNQMQ